MRSFDYSHFEIVLSADIDPMEGGEMAYVDSLRKEAARLADKAVAQYKKAKEVAETMERDALTIDWRGEQAERIRAMAETDRTPDDQALLKSYDDALHRAKREFYNYQDDYYENE